MFGPIQTTPYDLRFPVFGIPVHVTPWFWLGAVVMGWSLVNHGLYDLLAIWIGCVFVSILIHELGHAFLARAFGCPPQVFLYQFGGLAVFQPNYRFTTTRSVLVSLAGPGAGFLLFGLIYFLKDPVLQTQWISNLDHAMQSRIYFFFVQMEWINLWWGLVNLVPVLPLDGGRVAEALLMHLRRWDGRSLALKLSAVVAGAVAVFFLWTDEKYAAILFGLLCITNVQSLQQPNPW